MTGHLWPTGAAPPVRPWRAPEVGAVPGESPLIQSLRAAVAAVPQDVPLRVHLGELLLADGAADAAVAEAAVALQHAPGPED
ncbi:hypothetical protein ACL02R_15040 [Streptomyces sp. MS19]|uniref:hypothetical protein n=1 Tax=Streptomyces sp. MS19 TaxID=3385972 RepID=UPI0039A21D21